MPELHDATDDSVGLRPRQGFHSIPPELISRILSLLETRDIVLLRSVSKFFRDFTYDPMIWKTVYATSRQPRYPGPFPTQSTQFLERTLVRSEQLADSWLYKPIRFSSAVEIPHPGSTLPSPLMIDGRWLILCESSRQFVAYDFDSKPHSREVLWQKSGPPIGFWEPHTVTSDGGTMVYIAFTLGDGAWTILEFRISDDTNHLYHTYTLDIPDVIIPFRIPRQLMDLDDCHAPFFYLMRQELIFDSRTRSFYKFPGFTSRLAPASDFLSLGGDSSSSFSVIPVKTHIIRIHFYAMSTLLQAFVFPANPSSIHDEMGVLRLSHEGLIKSRLGNVTLLRNSVVDPMKGSTNIRFLSPLICDDLYFTCIDLTLPQKSDADPVLPITIKQTRLDDRVYYEQYNTHPDHMSYYRPSHDGRVRGFFRFAKAGGAGWPNYALSKCLAVTFEIHASDHHCWDTFGSVRPLKQSPFDEAARYSRVFFDGVRGRLCFVKEIRKAATEADPDDEPGADEEFDSDDGSDAEDESDSDGNAEVDYSIVVMDLE